MSSKQQSNSEEQQPEGPSEQDENLEANTESSADEDVGEQTGTEESDEKAELSPERTAVLEQQIAELKDQYIRAHAETENVRKRAENELANGRKFAIESFARELLNVRDSLGLASNVQIDDESAEADAVGTMYEGLELTLRQLDTVFERFGVKRVGAKVGDKLDPELHQAMSTIDSDEVDSGCIVDVVQSGYKLHERLLRAAMVIIAK